ncbi:MAG: hypothetical protein HYT48_01110 [Candidatus Vogelbacteria bacterium]|nr:hypothetical protein [Candidatus Vogelbacteria bacterium]
MTLPDWAEKIKLLVLVALTVSLIVGLVRLYQLEQARPPITIENALEVGESASVLLAASRTSSVPTGVFVASKNGQKYYPVACAGAKRIKAANRIYFVTAAEAERVGYSAAANCGLK